MLIFAVLFISWAPDRTKLAVMCEIPQKESLCFSTCILLWLNVSVTVQIYRIQNAASCWIRIRELYPHVYIWETSSCFPNQSNQ